MKCCFCGCTPEDPCQIGGGDTCLLNEQTRVCSAWACQRRLAIAKKREAAEQRRLLRKPSPARVHEMIMQKKREQKREQNRRYREKQKRLRELQKRGAA